MKYLSKFSFTSRHFFANNLRHFSAINDKGRLSDHYDVVISGGGMVGFAMACSLGKNKYFANQRILLVETSKKKPLNLGSYGIRVCALNEGSKQLLENLEAWRHIERARVCPVKRMQVWDACSDAMITFGSPNLSSDIAYIAENDLIVDSISKEVEQLGPQVDILYETQVVKYQLPKNSEEEVYITFNNGKVVSSSLVIGADGFNSKLRFAMKSPYISYNYNQMAVVATLRISEMEENQTAWQRFLPTGPIALLPLNNQLSSLVWSTDKFTAKSLLDASPDLFVDHINKALWGNNDRNTIAEDVCSRFDQILQLIQNRSVEEAVRQLPPSVVSLEGTRSGFPLGLGHAVHYIGNRTALIGDAAHRIHPMAGQGVNLGFGDVAALTDVLVETVSNGSDIGNLHYLRKYETQRQQRNLPIMGGVHGLHLLYATDWTPAVVLRSLGLQLTNVMTPLKHYLSQKAQI